MHICKAKYGEPGGLVVEHRTPNIEGFDDPGPDPDLGLLGGHNPA